MQQQLNFSDKSQCIINNYSKPEPISEPDNKDVLIGRTIRIKPTDDRWMNDIATAKNLAGVSEVGRDGIEFYRHVYSISGFIKEPGVKEFIEKNKKVIRALMQTMT